MVTFIEILRELKKLPLEKRIKKTQQIYFRMAAHRWFRMQEAKGGKVFRFSSAAGDAPLLAPRRAAGGRT